MRKKIFSLFLGNLLVKGTFIVLAGSVFVNLGNYIFHLIMGRWLGPVDYGILESLISILNMLLIPIGVLNLVVVKFISEKEKQKSDDRSLFLKYILRKSLVFGLIAFLIFMLSSRFFQNLLRIESIMFLFLIGIAFYINIFSTVFSSILQGKMEFKKYCLLNIFNSWSKLIIGIILVILGLKVIGAISAFTLSILLTAIIGYFLAKESIFGKKNKFREDKLSNVTPNYISGRVKQFFGASIISSLSLVSLFSVDVLLARKYLLPFEAGQYAALSVLGKIIYFASCPVIAVMFPLASEKHSKGENSRRLIAFSLLLVALISVAISFLFVFFSKEMINLLFGEQYLSSASHLVLFAVFFSLYSLCSLLISFYLSISKNFMVIFSLLSAVMQVFLLIIFHQSVKQIVVVNIIIMSMLLFVLFAFMFKTFCANEKCLPV